MNEIRIKAGDSLILSFWFNDRGRPIDTGNLILSAQVRAADQTLVANLTLLPQAQVGLVTATYPDTSGWPAGRLRCDLRVEANGLVVHTETFPIVVSQQVTQK